MSTPDYYCHPIFHRDPISDVSSATGYWLVTSQEALAPGPGVYTSWYVHVSPGTGNRSRPIAHVFYFAQGANEWTAERLALEATPETANNLPPPSSPHPRGGIVYPVTPSTVDTGAGPSEAAAEEERKRAAKATRLAAIQAGVEEKKQSGKAARRAALAAQQQQTDAQVEAQELADKQAKRMQIINKFLAATPPASTSRSNEFRAKTNLHSPSPPSSSKAAVFSPSPASNSKFKTGFQTPSNPFKPAPSPMLKIGGRVVERTPKAKSKGPSDGNESDALYEALDDDLAEVLADWVDPEYRYDPMTENKPRDNA
ncbi:hypothetical protein C8F04DRAFT_1267472 [Mycena alexandri]|uniref:Uncharacterized protein n=1 Tax=Mycena alexandri TaxID=1745969 RepID=A0AAD6SFL2_9AGAR|nr:hypothetical protein C8F04DRAFT_1267472 [Mycena alexandri]